jgi:hypothetical protein
MSEKLDDTQRGLLAFAPKAKQLVDEIGEHLPPGAQFVLIVLVPAETPDHQHIIP